MLVNLRDILKPAREHAFAVPAFNISTSVILRGVFEACQKCDSPVIIAVHPKELEFSMDAINVMVKELANRTKIPVCLHLDHGQNVYQAIKAVRCGFTSVMIDRSSDSFEDNIRETRQVVEMARGLDVSVEAELGTMGLLKSGGQGDGTGGGVFTRPEDVGVFVRETGVDALAISIGTVHGLYPPDMKPRLRLDILKRIREITDIPLVLHGGSANPDEEIRQAVVAGISKVNISSDVKSAFFDACRSVLSDPELFEPFVLYKPCLEAIETVVCHKIDLLGACGGAKYY